MLREFKFLGRNYSKTSEIEERENVPINTKESLVTHTSTDSTRAPLHSIPEPSHNNKALPEPEVVVKSKKTPRTPIKDKGKISDNVIPLRTPEKYGFSSKNRFGWAQKNELQDDSNNCTIPLGKGIGGFANTTTPKSTRTMGRANSTYSECNSTLSTPTRSVSKPASSSFFLASGSRPPINTGGHRVGNYVAMSKGFPVTCNSSTIVNAVEVPHFDLKEDPSFWMEHNVQVVIRVRPLNNNERSVNGYNRCLKQENAQCITWIGHPETRFTFDHVACETVDQETLFRMVGLPMVENCLSGYHSCVFAYGQTGSGKTYTMLGEMEELEVRPSPNRGMTARMFEFLFARIRAEEEIRRDERLKYSCRCSFLEIYNEQITDLLEPSSTNLQLREDTKNGVYVENLSEFEVGTVGDILKLLSQGSSNRRVATTNMNRESSRSHSVFTCVIESTWEKDATTNSRFSRMNLVDLAGSERQKSSGAEGERLKEAAGINKSLSTLGLVIMMLVDVAQGKPRHVPYRDSRLTFLLQDSLGGNSKTMIIANISPSICCAAESLNTLKFAQRAKLIQNNAVVNEDSSGDVASLQNQIRQLKEELNALKRQNVSRTLSFGSKASGDTTHEPEDFCDVKAFEIDHQQPDNNVPESEPKGSRRLSSKQMKSFETTLAGALRREQMSEISIQKLEAEIEQLNRLVRQREEYTQCTNMMLKLREEKIQRMESLVGGLIPTDSYLVEENSALAAEIKLLQTKVDKNPEVTRFAMEYDRVLEQVRKYQDFYEEGEREILLVEVSVLRNQLVHLLDGNSKQHNQGNIDMLDQEALRNSRANDTLQLELNRTLSQLEECRTNLGSCLERNEKLTRELEDLRATVSNLTAPIDHDSGIEVIKESIMEAPTLGGQPVSTIREDGSQMKCDPLKQAEDIMNLELEVDILKQILKEERSSHANVEEKELGLDQDLQFTKEKLSSLTRKYEEVNEELKEAKSVIDALESQQLFSINELEDLKDSNIRFAELISKRESEICILKEQLCCQELRDPQPPNYSKGDDSPLVVRLKKMQSSLEKAKELNMRYQSDHAYHESNEEEMDEIRKQVEAETAEVIICLQDELADLQKQVQDSSLKESQSEQKVHLLDQDNERLSEKLQEKEKVEAETAEALICLQDELASLQKQVQDSNIKEKQLEEETYLLDQDNKSLNKQLRETEKDLKVLSEKWELLAREIETVLADGNQALEDASDQVEFHSGSIQKENWVSDQVERIKKIITEKEKSIHELNQCLEDAQNRTSDLEGMLRSLKGATMAINEARQQECNERQKEILALNVQLRSTESVLEELQNKSRLGKEQLKQTATSATVAFIIVKRLSELNSKSFYALAEKDESICTLGFEINGAERLIQSLRGELHLSRESHDELRLQLSSEQQRACAMERKLLEYEENEILETSEKLSKLKAGVSTLRSSMDIHASDKDAISSKGKSEAQMTTILLQTGGETNAWKNAVEPCALGQDMETENSRSSDKDLAGHNVDRDTSDRDATIILLRKEIESALESLKAVQAEMAKLRKEKEEVMMYERSSQESTKSVVSNLVSLQQAMGKFENLIASNMGTLDHKLLAVEDIVQEIRSLRCQEKELLESELGDAKAVAAQKSAEASCVLAKFEEAQYTVREADIVINELMIANETAKLKIKGMKKKEMTLTEEKGVLFTQVQSLQSTIEMKSLHCGNLENQLASNFLEMKNLVSDLESIIAEVHSNSEKEFKSLTDDFLSMKGQLQDSTKSIRSWVEEIWSEIVIKDCAISVLHLCHMGLLLESVTGLNTENSLLHHGLSESNSVINELKEYSLRSRTELEMCRVLEGKLLADMKKGFDRISKKEDEAGELTVKLAIFQKKTLDLQEQEELMMERSDRMGFELSILMKELDQSNGNILSSLQEHETLLKNREEVLQSLDEKYMIDLCAKDFELLILASHFQRETLGFYESLEKMKRHIIFNTIDAELQEQNLLHKEDQIALLTKEIEEEKQVGQDLISKITQRNSTIEQIVKLKEGLEREVQFLKDSALSSDTLKSQLEEVTEAKTRLLSQVQNLEVENHRLHEEVKAKRMELEMASTRISAIDDEKIALEDELSLQQTSFNKVMIELKDKDVELKTMSCLETEKESVEIESRKLKESYCSIFQKTEVKSSEMVLNIKHCLDLLENLDVVGSNISTALNGEMFQQISEALRRTDKFVEELEILENSVSEILTENLTLQTELIRKDDVLNGLLFDLRMLQESASSNKDQKDEIEGLVASLEDLENELAESTREHDEAVENSRIVEAQLEEKMGIISSLRLDILKLHESINSLTSENLELNASFRSALETKKSIEEQLFETRKVNEALERENEEMGSAISNISNSLELLTSDLNDVCCERDELQEEVLTVKKQLEMAEALVEENKAIAVEAQEIAESRKVYADEKDEEVKLLETSVEELERTVNVLENKVNIIKEEAERQRLQREELEMELHSLKEQTSHVKCVNADMKRYLDEKENESQKSLEHIQILEKEIIAKDAEISECKAHITELNLHAEAQARDYKQKFKALECMAEQVKYEGPPSHGTNSSSSKLEKNGSKPRGSGSPFKCIGLGLSQQIKSERDEELTASRLRIEELEAIAANRQKEVFMLNSKLATTESMTHDVLRELSGLKLNLNKYSYLFDKELLEKISEKAEVQSFESQVKDHGVIKLKQQLNEFIEERKGWLDEIDRKQAEMVAAQMTLEELRQRERLLSTENEMIKMEHANHKRMITELEMEVKKLSGQQNLQQRIHHHAKIKEENNLLKSENQELSVRLGRMESGLARLKEVVSKHRLANGRSPEINLDEEHRLNQLLKETEEERLQLAQKLVGLCTSILKAAGVTSPTSDTSISAAEEALDRIKHRITSLEREMQDVKLKSKISSEKIRLSELMPQQSPRSPKTDENRPVFRAPHSPFLSSLDR